MPQEKDLSISERIFLSVYCEGLIGKGIEIPHYSKEILKSALNKAIDQVITLRQRDLGIDFFSSLETAFSFNLQTIRTSKSPVILVHTSQISFNTSKRSPYSIVVVQPKIPSKDHYEEEITQNGKLFVIKPEVVDDVKKELATIIDKLKKDRIDFVCFPELFFINKKEIHETFRQLAREKDCFIVAGSFHNIKEERNTCVIFSPKETTIEQNKIFKAREEGIRERPIEYLEMVDFLQASFCVLVCIDSERDALREILKERLQNQRCPILIFNPSDTEHPRRAINILTNNLMLLLAIAIVFCNTNQKGCSTILTPLVELKEKEFKLFEIKASTDTGIEGAQVDLELLMRHRLTKQEDVVSMIE